MGIADLVGVINLPLIDSTTTPYHRLTKELTKREIIRRNDANSNDPVGLSEANFPREKARVEAG